MVTWTHQCMPYLAIAAMQYSKGRTSAMARYSHTTARLYCPRHSSRPHLSAAVFTHRPTLNRRRRWLHFFVLDPGSCTIKEGLRVSSL